MTDLRSYSRPSDWDSRDLAGKIRWRCTHPSPDVDYAVLADKHRAKEFVRPRFPSARTYSLADTPEDIERRELPGTYVMKSTVLWNTAILVVDGWIRGANRQPGLRGRYAHNINLRGLARQWYARPHRLCGYELHYRFVQPRILFEEYLQPVDYELQFFLFSGVCRLTTVIWRGFHHYEPGRFRLYDQHWQRLAPGGEQYASLYDDSPGEVPYPGDRVFANLAALCGHIDHVRADFYASGGRLYFGEFTFTHNAGEPSVLGRYESQLSRYWPDVRAVDDPHRSPGV